MGNEASESWSTSWLEKEKLGSGLIWRSWMWPCILREREREGGKVENKLVLLQLDVKGEYLYF